MPPDHAAAAALPLYCVTDGAFAAWRDQQGEAVRAWLHANAFQAERGRWSLLPDAGGRNTGVVVGLGRQASGDATGWFWLGAALADRLPFASYRLADAGVVQALPFTLGWTCGGYRFQRYVTPRATQQRRPHLDPPARVDAGDVAAATAASTLARHLVNTPANDLGPDELEREALALADRQQGTLQVVQGEALRREFPLIAAVG